MFQDRALLRLEFDRKIFHLAWALLPLLYYLGFPRDGMLLLLFVELLIWAGIEVLRKAGYQIIPAGLMREHERRGAPMGTLFQIASMLLAVLLFPADIAILAMLFCCVGDSVTAVAGALLYPFIGRQKTAIRADDPKSRSIFAVGHSKSVVLMLAMFSTCLATGLLFYPAGAVGLISVGAIGAVLADAFGWQVAGFTLNDDLTIPLVSGGLMSLATLL